VSTTPPVFKSSERATADAPEIIARRHGHILELVINRPAARNALTPAASRMLDDAFTEFLEDHELWVAILTGGGKKAFCAGSDLHSLRPAGPATTTGHGFGGLTRRRMSKPVIAAVNGFALGGGFELALACHLIVADSTAQFGLPEALIGRIAGGGGLVRLPRLLPEKLAHEMILTGRRLTADEAAKHGLVNRVVAAGTARAEARVLAQQILAASPVSVRASLRVMDEARGISDPIEAMSVRSSALDEVLASDDQREGLAAWLGKRPPRWNNR